MQNSALRQGSVTLYAQLANIFRDRIYSGVWAEGEPVPTLDELVAEFGVARVTVRQAIRLLSDEGLLSSHRGKRTHVTWHPPETSERPIFSSIGSLDESPASYSVDILSYEEFETLPHRQLDKGEPRGPYVRIRKRDLYRGIPYVFSENYIRKDIYRQFPPGGETVSKIARLVRDAARPRNITGFEMIRVGMPNDEECGQLASVMSSPVARISRVFLDEDNSIMLYGNYVYREQEFGLVREITGHL